MKEIQLTQKQVALIDDADFELVSQYKWHAAWDSRLKGFYASTTVPHPLRTCRKYLLKMHRLIMGLEYGDKRQVDHIHGDTLDNRRDQLRIVTNRQNNQNRRIHRNGRMSGCYFDKHNQKWKAQTTVNGRHKHIGRFASEQLAHEAYLKFTTEKGLT